jgi:hypothetical protein
MYNIIITTTITVVTITVTAIEDAAAFKREKEVRSFYSCCDTTYSTSISRNRHTSLFSTN